MNSFILVPLLFILIAAYILGVIPIWILMIPFFGLPLFLLRGDLGLRGMEIVIFTIVGGLMVVFLFPPLFNQLNNMVTESSTTTTITSNSTTTEETILIPQQLVTSSTTSLSGISGILEIFVILMPVIIIISVFMRVTGIFFEDYTDDRGITHVGRTYRQYGYDYNTEQYKFERDILDMDKIFRSET